MLHGRDLCDFVCTHDALFISIPYVSILWSRIWDAVPICWQKQNPLYTKPASTPEFIPHPFVLYSFSVLFMYLKNKNKQANKPQQIFKSQLLSIHLDNLAWDTNPLTFWPPFSLCICNQKLLKSICSVPFVYWTFLYAVRYIRAEQMCGSFCCCSSCYCCTTECRLHQNN